MPVPYSLNGEVEVSHSVSHRHRWQAQFGSRRPATSLLLWGKTTSVSAGASDYGSLGWRPELPQVCRLLDDGDVRTDTGELPNSSDGDLGCQLQG